jgi:hypothetical protein
LLLVACQLGGDIPNDAFDYRLVRFLHQQGAVTWCPIGRELVVDRHQRQSATEPFHHSDEVLVCRRIATIDDDYRADAGICEHS